MSAIQSARSSALGIGNGILNAAGFKKGGTALASTDLSDSTDLLKNPSPALTTPTVTGGTFSSPTFTGTPVAPTPTAGDSSTKVATTAFVSGALGASRADRIDSPLGRDFASDRLSRSRWLGSISLDLRDPVWHSWNHIRRRRWQHDLQPP